MQWLVTPPLFRGTTKHEGTLSQDRAARRGGRGRVRRRRAVQRRSARGRGWPRRPWRTFCTTRGGPVAFAWHRSTSALEPHCPFWAAGPSSNVPSWAITWPRCSTRGAAGPEGSHGSLGENTINCLSSAGSTQTFRRVRRHLGHQENEAVSLAPRCLEEGGARHARDEARNVAVGRFWKARDEPQASHRDRLVGSAA